MRQVGYLQRLYRDARSTEHRILPIALRTTRLNIQRFCMVITLHSCVLVGSQKKQ